MCGAPTDALVVKRSNVWFTFIRHFDLHFFKSHIDHIPEIKDGEVIPIVVSETFPENLDARLYRIQNLGCRGWRCTSKHAPPLKKHLKNKKKENRTFRKKWIWSLIWSIFFLFENIFISHSSSILFVVISLPNSVWFCISFVPSSIKRWSLAMPSSCSTCLPWK